MPVDRYLEAVAARSGYRIEPIRVHLEVGFEKIAEPLLASNALEPSMKPRRVAAGNGAPIRLQVSPARSVRGGE